MLSLAVCKRSRYFEASDAGFWLRPMLSTTSGQHVVTCSTDIERAGRSVKSSSRGSGILNPCELPWEILAPRGPEDKTRRQPLCGTFFIVTRTDPYKSLNFLSAKILQVLPAQQ